MKFIIFTKIINELYKFMAKLLPLNTFESDAGDLTVFEKILPGEIKRVFYIRGKQGQERGGHRHINTWQALICISGSCRVFVDDNKTQEVFYLDSPEKCLLLAPEDWHVMDDFSDSSILLVLANTHFEKDDYVFEPYGQTMSVEY
jgi:quercetin dioxygenase-like cupin family protein